LAGSYHRKLKAGIILFFPQGKRQEKKGLALGREKNIGRR